MMNLGKYQIHSYQLAKLFYFFSKADDFCSYLGWDYLIQSAWLCSWWTNNAQQWSRLPDLQWRREQLEQRAVLRAVQHHLRVPAVLHLDGSYTSIALDLEMENDFYIEFYLNVAGRLWM